MGEETVQTSKLERGNESCSGTHNRLVVGSIPTTPTIEGTKLNWSSERVALLFTWGNIDKKRRHFIFRCLRKIR